VIAVAATLERTVPWLLPGRTAVLISYDRRDHDRETFDDQRDRFDDLPDGEGDEVEPM
jgi:hypothetical protein